jgi:GT2 family glycosyltransferase
VGKLPKVLIGIPSRGVIPHAFVETMNGALIGNGELFNGNFAHAMFHVPDNARNTFVETALEGDYDYVFMMDTDMTFPKGALALMIRHMGSIAGEIPPVIGGVYCNRGSDFRWHVYKWVEDENGWHSLRFPLNKGLYKVDAIGTGCMLIDVNVFKIIEWPWFEYSYAMFQGKRDRISEDMTFCKKCMEAGIPIYADTDITCGHFLSAQVVPTSDGGYQVETMAGDVL